MILTANGKTLSMGGRLLRASVAEPPPADLTTSLTLVDFYIANANGVYMAQRKAGTENDPDGGNADIEVGFTYAGGLPQVEARVVLKDAPTTVVKNWTLLVGQVAANGSGVGVLPNVTAGGKYLLQIRDGKQPTNTATQASGTTAWGVGVVDEASGQSNMLSTMGAGVSTDIVQGTALSEWNYIRSSALIANVFTVDGWGEPTSSGLVGRFIYMRMLAKALEAKHGKKIPVGLVLWAIDSQSIQSFLPDDPSTKPTNRTLFTNSGAGVGACGFASPYRVWSGDVEALGFHQGEANNTNTAAVYKDYMVRYVDMQVGFFAAKGRTHQNLSFMPAVLGVFSAGVRYVEYLRQGVLDFQQHAEANSWNKMRVGWTTLDCLGPPENTLHFQGEDKHKSVRRLIQSRLYRLDPDRARFDCSGPRLAGTATRSGNVVTLPVAGGKTLVAKNAGPITGFSANTKLDFSGTNLTITDVTPVAGGVQVTVDHPGPFAIKHCGGLVGTQESANSDITNLLYEPVEYPFFDNGAGVNIFTGTDVRNGLPLFPTPTAIQVA